MHVREYFVEDPIKEDSLFMGILLALAIGFMNACTYMSRGHVFASSQSGNILYMGMDLAQGDFSQFPKYLFCILMFGLGVFLSEHFHARFRSYGWRKISTILEIILIFCATLMPCSWNMIANPIFGLTCGLQSFTFRRFHQIPLATITINSNIQNLVGSLTRFLHLKHDEDLEKSLIYGAVAGAYLGGIIIGAMLIPFLGHYVSLLSIVCLLAGLIFLRPGTSGTQATSRS